MTTASIPSLINREAMGKALAQARTECATDKRWLNAVNRAALNLEACQWQFDGHTLVIKSASEDLHYTVTPDGCECKAFLAGRPCWHRAARRLLLKAAEIAQVPAPRDTCPMCGSVIEAIVYAVNNRNYMYFEMCSGDGVHKARTVIPGTELPEFENA